MRSGGRASIRTRTYAALRSVELALATPVSGMVVSSIRKEKPRELIERRRHKCRSTTSIGEHSAVSHTPRAGPGTQVRLRLGEDEYKLGTQRHTSLRQTSRHDGTCLHETNTLVFSRTVDETDLLREAPKIGVWIESWSFTFTWTGVEKQRADGTRSSVSG